MAERIIYSGDAGTRFTNETGRVLYQFIAALNNTCGVCLQYHLKISAAWPIPMHYGCRCIQRMIKPGQQAQHDFVDYRKLLDAMPEHDKAAAIGASNYRLLKSGLAKWEDIVTPNRVRDFREVVAKKKLTVKQMVDHGVKKFQAEKAYSAVHTEEHEHIERQRKELLQKLTGAGLSQENLVAELSSRLAARVTIAPGPTGPYTTGPAWSGGPLPGTGGSGAAELAGLIAGWKPRRQKAAMGKKLPEPEKKKDETPQERKPEWKPTMSAAGADTLTADSVVKEKRWGTQHRPPGAARFNLRGSGWTSRKLNPAAFGATAKALPGTGPRYDEFLFGARTERGHPQGESRRVESSRLRRHRTDPWRKRSARDSGRRPEEVS